VAFVTGGGIENAFDPRQEDRLWKKKRIIFLFELRRPASIETGGWVD
jgi:hypothetical protein